MELIIGSVFFALLAGNGILTYCSVRRQKELHTILRYEIAVIESLNESTENALSCLVSLDAELSETEANV